MSEKWEILRKTVNLQLNILEKTLEGFKDKSSEAVLVDCLIKTNKQFLLLMEDLDGWENKWKQEKKLPE